jgi:hypothetical protein
MKKKIYLALWMFLLAATTLTGKAWAGVDTYLWEIEAGYPNHNTWYMTDYGQTHLKNTFSIAETPYLFVHLLQTPPPTSNFAISWWTEDGNNSNGPYNFNIVPDVDNVNNNYWFTLFDGTVPGINKTIGAEWRVEGDVANFNEQGQRTGCIGCGGNTGFKFTAVPEPISAGLFLLGGAGIAVIRKRKNKKV